MSDFVLQQHESLTISPDRTSYSLETTAELTGVQGDVLQEYCRLGLLGPAPGDAPVTFDETALYEVRRIEHLRREFGLTLQALPLLCSLLHEVERLRNELRHLRG
jgi:DNA-binding transcriptional MerR regulator